MLLEDTYMRVISGSARGTVLHSIEDISTRPTLDRVKESLFNIIQNDIEMSKTTIYYLFLIAMYMLLGQMERRNMDKDKFNKAIEINNKIEEYKDHKMALENSNIKYGGGLIFTYNRMHNDVPLKEEIFGKNFLQCYMYALDSKIKELQKEFDKL